MKKAFWLIPGFIAFYTLASISTAYGQNESQLWITWRAATYTPAEYRLKSLPVESSKMVVALDLIQAGKVVDLRNDTIYWYQNDKFLTGGTGLTRIALTVPEGAGRGGLRVRAMLPDRGGVAKTLSIPVVNPEAIVQTPGEKVGSSFYLKGIPFFFNVIDPEYLTYKWTISGKEPFLSQDPSLVQVSVNSSLASGTNIPIVLTIDNPTALLESAQKKASVLYEH